MDASTGVLVCLGCPAGITFGIDAMQWTLGPKFCGVQQIPPGLHFVHHSQGHDTGSGEFVLLAAGDVLVRRWDEATETFAPDVSADDVARALAALREGSLAGGLGPYPHGEVGDRWRVLTASLTPQTLARAGVPLGTRVVPGDAEAEAAAGAQPLVPYVEGAPRAPRFTPVAARRLAGMTAAEVTAYNLRPELRLARLLAEEHGGAAASFVAEFELAFVLFLLLSSLPAFEHWKAALHLVSACDAGAPAWPQLALGVVSALVAQLALTPTDMFRDAMTEDSFLLPALAALARAACAPSSPPALREAGEELREFVHARFALRLSPTPSEQYAEDEQPTVAEDDTAHAMAADDAHDAGAGAEGAADATPATEPAGDAMAMDAAAAAEAAKQRMSWMLPPPPETPALDAT